MTKYIVKVTRVTEYEVTADTEQEAMALAVEESPEAMALGGIDDAVAVEIMQEVD